jgi:hypothetical protein
MPFRMLTELNAAQAATATPPAFRHLDTYFLFPFALDKEAIQADHPDAWPGETPWIEGLDSWIAGHSGRCEAEGMSALGAWTRSSYSEFGIESPAYSDMLYFHSIVRHVFFDSTIGRHPDDQENQLRCYTMQISTPDRLWLEGSDALGRGARAEINDLRLYLSAQGVGVLSLGVTAESISAATALWINRRLRKLYPLDSSSLMQGRTPNWLALRLQRGNEFQTLCEERFEKPAMVGFYPPLPKTITSLLYFADYSEEEFEPVLDENLLVYSYGELEPADNSTPQSVAELESLVDEFLHLGHTHSGPALHSPRDARVLLGFTTHSCSLLRLGPSAGNGDATSRPAASIAGSHDDLDLLNTFHTRYYLMTVIALFYRAVLLDFSERSALVSRRLLQDEQTGRLTQPSITMVNGLRTEFLNFSSYWHFDDISCKQVDNDLFRRQCAEYKVHDMKDGLTTELGHMADFVYNFYQMKNTDAVNRLAILSLIFGGGAVLTGFFGMNFGREFAQVFFEGERAFGVVHYFMITLVCSFVFGSLVLGIYVVLRNWREYLTILNPPKKDAGRSLKRHR